MRIAWATELDGTANAYGFTLGNRWGRKCLEQAGVEIDPEARLAIHHCPPHAFKPVKGKFNVLWTAWEFEELPPWEIAPLAGADYVLVTARFLIDVFAKHVAVPVEYASQGIDTEHYFPKQKQLGRKTYRMLWIGAPNQRKGYQFVLGAWRAFIDHPDYVLYCKTTGGDEKCARAGNIIFDSRNLPQKSMSELYQSADLFIFPTMGEGFGFTLGEAMASGLPCIYTPCTSLLDLADDHCAIPLEAKLQSPGFKLAHWRITEDVANIEPDGKRCVLVPAWEPDATDLARKIMWCKAHKGKAEKIGRRAAVHIRRNFTWQMAGQRLRDILERIERNFLQEAA